MTTNDFWKGQRQAVLLQRRSARRLFDLNWTLTPQSDDAKNEAVCRLKDLIGAVAGTPGLLVDEIVKTFIKKLSGGVTQRPSLHSLEQLSHQANATLWDFVAANEGKKINFVSVDFFQNGRAVELAVNLSHQLIAKAAVAGVS